MIVLHELGAAVPEDLERVVLSSQSSSVGVSVRSHLTEREFRG